MNHKWYEVDNMGTGLDMWECKCGAYKQGEDTGDGYRTVLFEPYADPEKGNLVCE